MIERINSTQTSINTLSLAQLCELFEHNRVKRLMTPMEKTHIEAMSGPSHKWGTTKPLSHLGYTIKPAQFLAAIKRRLKLDVVRKEK